MKLTFKEESFCIEYCRLRNGTRAAIVAGYSPNSARSIAKENLTKPHIQAKIEEIRAEYLKQAKLEAEDVINELINQAYWNIQDFVGEGNVIKDLTTLDRETTSPVAGIKVKETFITIDGKTTKEVTTELKLTDKRAALVDLGRHVGIFKEDNNQKATKIKVTRK